MAVTRGITSSHAWACVHLYTGTHSKCDFPVLFHLGRLGRTFLRLALVLLPSLVLSSPLQSCGCDRLSLPRVQASHSHSGGSGSGPLSSWENRSRRHSICHRTRQPCCIREQLSWLMFVICSDWLKSCLVPPEKDNQELKVDMQKGVLCWFSFCGAHI